MNEVERLQRRIERERSARHEAESIAERGLRELFEANTDLDRRVAERTAELDAARHELLAAQSTRQRILANLSHELRTPLHAVVASLDLLASSVDRDPELLDTARREAANLDRLLGQLFDLVEIDGSTLVAQLTSAEVDRVWADTASRWRDASLAKGQLLMVEVIGEVPLVVADPQQLTRAVEHLIVNAVNHGVAGAVRCRVEAVAAGVVRCSITDAGPGFDPNLPWGAGLKAASGLLEAMGSGLEIDTAVGAPTTASFDLVEFGSAPMVA